MHMKAIEVRYATIEDCETLSNIIATVIQNIPYYNDLARKNEILKFQLKDLQVKISEDKYSVILATADNKIAGFCLSRFDDYLIWLEWFGVLENYRGNGIANLLLKELDKTVLPRKSHKIWCDCRTVNEASIHILSFHGYTQMITIQNHWYKQDFIIWEKVF